MKSITFLFVCFLLSFSACKKKVATTSPSDYKINVVSDNWTTAKADAVAGNKNIVLMLHATWCTYCKTFIKDVITNEEVAAAINNKIVFALIDAEKGDGPSLKSQYGGDGFPFFVITDQNGVKLTSRQGSLAKDDFLSFVNLYLK